MSEPVCPEHGAEMRHELAPNWWRGKCGCPIRVFEEDREAYVPACTLVRTTRGLHGGNVWNPQRGSITVWVPVG